MSGWQALQLVEVARLPQRPSDLLEMREAGYGAATRLGFDLAVVSFANRFDDIRRETVERPAPDHRNRKPTVQVPKHTHRELLRMLGIVDDGSEASAAVGRSLTDSDWDFLEDGEGG